MAKRGKKVDKKAEAAKAEAAKAEAAKAEKSATSRSTSKGAAASQPEHDDRDDNRRHGASTGEGRRKSGGDDGGSPGEAGAFEFAVTVLQCDGLKLIGKSGHASVFVGLSAGSASGQSAAVPYDGGRPQWNRGRGCVPADLAVANVRCRVADSCSDVQRERGFGTFITADVLGSEAVGR